MRHYVRHSYFARRLVAYRTFRRKIIFTLVLAYASRMGARALMGNFVSFGKFTNVGTLIVSAGFYSKAAARAVPPKHLPTNDEHRAPYRPLTRNRNTNGEIKGLRSIEFLPRNPIGGGVRSLPSASAGPFPPSPAALAPRPPGLWRPPSASPSQRDPPRPVGVATPATVSRQACG